MRHHRPALPARDRALRARKKYFDRLRILQRRGEFGTIEGLLVTGMVRSVLEDRSSTPTRWIVTVAARSLAAA
jgi:hypothetical protein